MSDQFGNSDADLERGDQEYMRQQEDAPIKVRTHFVRILGLAAVNTLIDRINKVADKPFHHIKTTEEFFEIKAPDGDVVFAGLRKNRKDPYICRLHKEVFSEDS